MGARLSFVRPSGWPAGRLAGWLSARAPNWSFEFVAQLASRAREFN